MTEAPSRRPATGARLSVHALSCKRGDRVLFRGFDLALRAGDVVWLRAANGIGKTSLLRLMAGLAQPEEGTVEREDGARAPLYLGHANGLKDDLTARESLAFLATLHGLPSESAALDDALRRFGLGQRRDASTRTLSQGQRRRVALARLCLASSCPVWLLDEPFDALDAEATALVATVIAEHARRGGAVLYTSHVPVAVPLETAREVELLPPPAA